MGKAQERWAVPYLLSFDLRDGKSPHGFRMGTGDAGWTVAYFSSEGEARSFADSIPHESRVRNHGYCRSAS